ncbi:hypothetical protein DSECCO2_599960 [anaerobic digester metagenome]
MDEIAQKLRRASQIAAAHRRVVVITRHRMPAGGADFRQMIHRHSPVLNHREYLWDDLAGLAHQHNVANGNLLFVDKILIVQHRAGNGRACQRDRLKHRSRGQHAGAPHLDLNIQERRRLFLRRVFICNCPARKFCGLAESFSICKAIYFYNGAVDIIGIFTPVFPDAFDCFEHRFNVCDRLPRLDGVKALRL